MFSNGLTPTELERLALLSKEKDEDQKVIGNIITRAEARQIFKFWKKHWPM